MNQLTLYTRRGCCLCEELLEELLPRVRARADLRVVDVDTSPELVARYGTQVPVLLAGDTEICRVRLDVDLLERHLQANVQAS